MPHTAARRERRNVMRREAWAAALIGGVLALGPVHGEVANAATVTVDRQLLAAIENTDVAGTYVEATNGIVSGPAGSMHRVLHNEYDNAHDREQDHAEYTITTRTLGRTKTLRYTLDLIMLDGRTYYRSSLHDRSWKVKKGYGYTDPASGDHWIRSGLNYSFILRYKPVLVGHTGNQLEYQIRVPGRPYPGRFTYDIWIDAGSHPYIVRVFNYGGYTKNGQRFTIRHDTRLSDYNRPLDIRAP
jgi:hypothetical protein